MADDLERRLLRCFAAVFPDLGEAEMRSAASGVTGRWDSLATVMLVSLVEEEFHLEMPHAELEKMVSYAAIADCLRRLGAGGPPAG